MTIGLIDMIVLGILIFSVLFALYRGLVSELLGISAWILAGLGALYSYSPMQPVMKRFIENEKLAGLCGALLVGLVILVIMTIINAHIANKLRQSSLSGLDRLLGFVFGLLRGIVLIALLYMGASVILSDEYMAEVSKENVSVPYIQKTIQFMKNFVPKSVQSDLGMSLAGEEEKPKKIGVDLKRDHKLPEKSHQKAIQNFVNDVTKEANQKVTKKVTDKAKEKAIEKIKEKGKEKTKSMPQNKNTQSKAKEAAVTPQYDAKQRESLDNMIEELMEKGE